MLLGRGVRWASARGSNGQAGAAEGQVLQGQPGEPEGAAERISGDSGQDGTQARLGAGPPGGAQRCPTGPNS